MEGKYISKLSDEDLLDLHKFAIDSSAHRIHSRKNTRSGHYVCFIEEKCFETNYRYIDFEPPASYDAMGDTNRERIKFFKWMTNHFGKEYLKDYLVHKGFNRDCIDVALDK